MAQNLKLDPVKRDYVIVNGSPVGTDRVLEATYIAVMIPQGKWLYGAPTQGSLVHTLEGKKRDASVEELFSEYSKNAINDQVVNVGQATDVAVYNLASSRTGTSNQISVIPAAVQLSQGLGFIGV